MRKFILGLILFIAVAAAITAVSLPSILSSRWGKDLALKFINEKIKGDLAVDGINFSWSGPQKITGITLKDPQGNTVVSLGEFSADTSLRCMARTPLECGNFAFKDLNAYLKIDGQGFSNLERSLFSDCCTKTSDVPAQDPVHFTLQNLHGTLRLPKGETPLQLKIEGETTYNAQAGKISLDVGLSEALVKQLAHDHKHFAETLKHSEQGGLVVKAELTNFPTAIFDQMLVLCHSPHAGIVAELLGNTLEATLEQSIQEKGAVLALRGKSPYSTFSGDLLAGEAITLIDPIEIHLNIQPGLLKRLRPDEPEPPQAVPTWLTINQVYVPLDALEDPEQLAKTPIEIQANLVKFPLGLFLPEGLKKAGVQLAEGQPVDFRGIVRYDGSNLTAGLTASPLQFAAAAPIGNFSINQISATLGPNANGEREANLTAALTQSEPGYFKELLGEHTDLDASLAGPLLEGESRGRADFTLGLRSPAAVADMAGTLHPDGVIRFTQPAKLKYTLTEAAISHLGLTKMTEGFQVPSVIEATVTTLHLPADGKNLTHLNAKGSLFIDTLAPASKQASLDEIKAQWMIDGSNNVAAIDFYGLTRFGQEAAGKVSGSFVVEHWLKDQAFDIADASGKVTLNAHRLPVEIIAFNYGGSDIAKVFGNMIDVTISAKTPELKEPKGTALVTVRSDKLIGDISLAIDKSIHLSSPDQPGAFVLTLTPESHAAIRNLLKRGFNDPFQLTDSSKISLTLNSLNIPLPLAPGHAALNGSIEIDQLVGIDKRTQQRLSLGSITANVSSTDISEEIKFTMVGNGLAASANPASINLQGSVIRLLTSDGRINTNDLSLNVDGTLAAIPAPLLCKVMCSDTLLSNQSDAIFGPTFDATIKIQLQRMNGPLSINAHGKNGSISVAARIQDGILTLEDNLTAQFAITPQLGQYVLQVYIPILNGIQSSDQPLQIVVDKRGFAVPIKEINPLTVALGSAKIDFGKVRFSPQSQLASALSLLTPPNAEALMVWLTPIYLSMNGGIVKLERVDLLLNDRFPLAAWGTVNFDKDKVDMIIGLSGAAIDSAFAIPSVPKGYMLQVPFRGPLNNPSLDKTRVVGRLSALAAQAQGGPHGAVIGSVLDVLSGGLKESQPPQPTTQPLPWQQLMDDPQYQTDQKSVTAPVTVPIEEITRGANKLLQKVLKKK